MTSLAAPDNAPDAGPARIPASVGDPRVPSSGSSHGWVWIPVLLVTLYYALPAAFFLDRPWVAAMILVPAGASLVAFAGRQAHPRLATVVTIACLVASPAALGGVIGVLASRARHVRHRREVVEVIGSALVAAVAKVVQLLIPVGRDGWTSASSVELTISLSVLGFAVLAGLLGRSVAESAASSQRAEQARAAEIRLEERARIAREMHDVVAHRISLVAMTSGALVYRDDLPEEAHEAATIIQSNARLALDELRALLSDLRDGDGSVRPMMPEAPQPDLGHLPILLAEVREVTEVDHRCDLDTSALPTTVSRQLYRIVQEGLTNARKHAPGQPVSVRLARAGGDLVLEVGNRVTGGVTGRDTGRGGYGLVGIQERARMLGGRARVHVDDDRFVLTVTVPARVVS